LTDIGATLIEQSDHTATPPLSGEKDVPVIRVEARGRWTPLRLREIWASRELLYFLIWRDVNVRYKQTVFGAAWAIIQPFSAMVVFSLFFGRLAKMPSEGVPYPVFSYAALVPWTFFANGLTHVSNSLVRDTNLVTKVYLPRLVLPFSAALGGLIDFGVALIVLFGMMVAYRIPITVNVVFLPFLVLLALATSIGVGLWLSALNVQYRDVRYVVPFLTQAWLFATPVVYPSSLLPARWHVLYGLNPMAGVVEGFRWALLGTHTHPGPMILVSVVTVLAVLVSGAFYFRRVESRFADVV
jgi:homopolymeric O-antigen transport system permease protein